MNGPFFVEVLSRHNEVRHRQQVNGLPIRIGRGYDNDVILDDPHVAARHAEVASTEDGRLVIRDRGSRNRIVHKGKRKSEFPVSGDAVFRMGQTSLRIRTVDYPVAGEVAETRFRFSEGWPPALAGIFLVAGLTVALTRLGDADAFEPTRYLSAVLSMLCLGMIWCGIWSFAGRLFGGQARLGRHLFILGCGFAAIACWNFVKGAVGYALSLEVFTRYGSHVVVAIVAGMVFFHLLHVRPHRVRLFAIIGLGVTLLGSGIMLLINYGNNGRLADEQFMHAWLPPVTRLSPDRPAALFMEDAARLKARVDAERSKPVNGRCGAEWDECGAGTD